jgi:hypothetical protein
MLINEAMTVGNFSHRELDKTLSKTLGNSFKYKNFSSGRYGSINAGSVQTFEATIAKLLGRPAHPVIIENLAFLSHNKMDEGFQMFSPDAGLDLRRTMVDEIQLGYQDHWPTFYQLIYSLPIDNDGTRLIDKFIWQYQCLWQKGVIEYSGADENFKNSDYLQKFIEQHVNNWLENQDFLKSAKVRYLNQVFGFARWRKKPD